MKWVFLIFLPLLVLADRIAIVSNFDVTEMPLQKSRVLERGIDIEIRCINGSLPDFKDPLLQRVVVMNNCLSFSDLCWTPKEKLILFLWEPYHLELSYYDRFSKIYTWDDRMVDGKKFFKLYYPHLRPMRTHLPCFKQKKFCTLIASNWTAERLEMIDFFSKKPDGELDVYGKAHQEPVKSLKLYKGPIEGHHSGPEKYEILKNYKFCICFENTVVCPGYITEKIFGCFAAGCVPIYWGAPNVEKYIPRDCFIDYRQFKNPEEMYNYLKQMTEDRYNAHLTAIRKFLRSEQAEKFSPEHFDLTLDQAISF